MPAPTAQSIETFLTQSLLSQGFVKKEFVNGALVSNPTELPDDMKRLVKGLSVGLSQQWVVWQAAQVVNVPGVTSGPATTFGSLTP